MGTEEEEEEEEEEVVVMAPACEVKGAIWFLTWPIAANAQYAIPRTHA